MKRGQRPRFHHRTIKTRQGVKTIPVNRTVQPQRRLKRKRIATGEFMRKIKQQFEMNIAKDKEEVKELEKEQAAFMNKLNKEREVTRRKEQAENEETTKIVREQVERDFAAKDAHVADKIVVRKIGELERLGKQIDRMKKPERMIGLYDNLDIDAKLDKARNLAKASGNNERIKEIDKIRDSLHRKMLEPRFDTGHMSGHEKKMFELGKKMLAMPEVRKTTSLTTSAPSVEEYERMVKQRIKTAESEERQASQMERMIKQNKSSTSREEYNTKQELFDFARKAKLEAEKEAGLSRREADRLRAEAARIKKERRGEE